MIFSLFETHGERSVKNSENAGVGSGWQYKQLHRAGFFYKMFFCIFVVFGLEIYSKRAILVPKSVFQSPKRIFQVAKQNPWPEGRYGELEVRNGTKPYQRDELHPKCVFKNFETEF